MVQVSPDGNRLASVDNGGRLRVWDVASRSLRLESEGYDMSVVAPIIWHPDGERILAGFDDRGPVLFDCRNRSPAVKPVGVLEEFRSGVVGRDGIRFVRHVRRSTDVDGKPREYLVLCRMRDGKELAGVQPRWSHPVPGLGRRYGASVGNGATARGAASASMTGFQDLSQRYAWVPIPGCPGRFRLAGPRSPLAAAELVGDGSTSIELLGAACRDPVELVRFADGGGVLSYVHSDGSRVHTLNTAEGLARKLCDLLGPDDPATGSPSR